VAEQGRLLVEQPLNILGEAELATRAAGRARAAPLDQLLPQERRELLDVPATRLHL
jgi:hypothetical protein